MSTTPLAAFANLSRVYPAGVNILNSSSPVGPLDAFALCARGNSPHFFMNSPRVNPNFS